MEFAQLAKPQARMSWELLAQSLAEVLFGLVLVVYHSLGWHAVAGIAVE
jgi:hypothetical protein